MQNSAEMGGLEDKRSDGTRRVAAVPGLAILPTDGEEIRTAAEKSSEQGNFVFDCRIPIDEVAGFFRRDNFDSSGLLTRCRLQGLDLGYDRRTLQRSVPIGQAFKGGFRLNALAYRR